MICTRCGLDTAPEHMSTVDRRVCRRCTYKGLPGGDTLADQVNAQATRKHSERLARQAPRRVYREDE